MNKPHLSLFKTLLIALWLWPLSLSASTENDLTDLSINLNKILKHSQVTFKDPRVIEVADSLNQGNKLFEDSESFTLCYYIKGRHYLLTKQLSKLRLCLEMLKKNVTHPVYCSYYYSLHALYVDILISSNRFQEAMHEFTIIKNVSSKNNNKYGHAICVQKLGDLYFYQGYYPNALEQYLRNEEYYIENDIPLGFYNLYNSIAECFSEMEVDSVHDDYFAQAQKYALSNLQRSAITISKLNAQLKHKNIFPDEKTIRNLQKSIKADVFPQHIGSNYYLLLSNYYLHKKDTTQSIIYLDSIHNVLRRYDLKRTFYAKIGDMANAYHFSQLHAKYSHALLQKNNFDLLAKYASEYDNIRLLEVRQGLRVANLMLSIWIGVILLVSFLLFFIFYVYNKQKVECRLRQEKERAEKAEHLKSLFLQNMSHEIRTPLNAIVGFNEVLNTEIGSSLEQEERDECLQIIRSNSDLLITLINDILDISKFESGTYSIKMSEIDINELCNNSIESIRMRVKENVSVHFIRTQDDFLLRTDKHRLNQVISNLLTNACKHTQQGNIILTYEIQQTHVVFSVTDTGTGIPDDQIENIFNRFEMLDKSTNGLGLGLHICKIIANLLKARVYVDREYKHGARFVFEHPLDTFSIQ